VYAIVQCGGHQVKMVPGATVVVDRLEGTPGGEITFDQVLLVEKDGGEVLAGAPFVANARVVAVLDGESRGPKIRIFKKKRRKGMRRSRGFRADLSVLRVKDIVV
jgi:large subunit ribosomal protein L21